MDYVKDYAMRAVDLIRTHPKTTGVIVLALVLAVVLF